MCARIIRVLQSTPSAIGTVVLTDIPRAYAMKHSSVLRAKILDSKSNTIILPENVSQIAIRTVIVAIANFGGHKDFYIRVAHRPILEVILCFDAARKLGLNQEVLEKMVATLLFKIKNEKYTGDDMKAISVYLPKSASDKHSAPYWAMIKAFAWQQVGGNKYTNAEIAQLESTYSTNAVLMEDMNEQVAQFQKAKAARERALHKQEADARYKTREQARIAHMRAEALRMQNGEIDYDARLMPFTGR